MAAHYRKLGRVQDFMHTLGLHAPLSLHMMSGRGYLQSASIFSRTERVH